MDRGLKAEVVRAILSAEGFGTDGAADGPLLIALGQPLRLVWANPQATALFGTDDAVELQRRLFAGHGREALTTVIAHLVPNGGVRTQRLRLIDGFRTRSVTVAVSRSTPAPGIDAVLLAVPGGTPAGRAATDATENALQGALGSDDPAPLTADVAVPSASPPAPRDPPPAWASLGSHRFIWRTDASGRVCEINGLPPAVPALAGIGEGRLADLARALGADPAGGLAAAMAGGTSWSGLRTLWPIAPGWAVPIVFGAAVVRGLQREALGYRGFGVCDFAALVPREAVPGDEAPVPSRVVAPAGAPVSSLEPGAAPEADPVETVAPGAVGGVPPSADDLQAGEALAEPPITVVEPPTGERATTPPLPAPAMPSARGPYGSPKVVMLRPPVTTGGDDVGAMPLGDGRPGEGAPGDAPQGDDRRAALPPLSSAEQLAFDAIARALKASAAHKAASHDLPPLNDAEAMRMWGALPLAVLVTCGGRPVFGNATFAALTGFPALADFEAAGGLAYLLGGLDMMRVAESDADRTFPIVDASGAVLTVEGRVAMLAWDGATADMLTFRPAADHVAEVQSLRLQIARLRTEAADAQVLLDRVADAAAIVDGQGRLLSLNSTGSRLFGREAGSTVGESIGILLTPESQNAALGAIFAAGNAGPDGADNRITVSGRRRDGESRLALTMVTRALGHGRIAVVFHDGSEVEAARGEARLLRDELAQTGTSRVDFLAKVSHEIRTPLNAILGFAEIMLDERFGPIGNPRYKDYLGDIRAAGQHVNDLVSDLLDLSSVQAGQRALTVVASDVNRIVGESVAEAQGQAHRDRVIVRLSLMPHLPSALVDETAMRQVMDNILSNAIRFNEPGGQVIVSTAVKEGGAITVRVRDTGVGMTESELAIATEPFRQISTGKPAGGSGLGLPLTQALVEANGATMTISSRKSEGTLVEVVLPAKPGQPMSVPAA